MGYTVYLCSSANRGETVVAGEDDGDGAAVDMVLEGVRNKTGHNYRRAILYVSRDSHDSSKNRYFTRDLPLIFAATEEKKRKSEKAITGTGPPPHLKITP